MRSIDPADSGINNNLITALFIYSYLLFRAFPELCEGALRSIPVDKSQLPTPVSALAARRRACRLDHPGKVSNYATSLRTISCNYLLIYSLYLIKDLFLLNTDIISSYATLSYYLHQCFFVRFDLTHPHDICSCYNNLCHILAYIPRMCEIKSYCDTLVLDFPTLDI